MLALWIVLGVVVWVALMTLVVALCTASGRADRTFVTLRRAPRRSTRFTALPRI